MLKSQIVCILWTFGSITYAYATNQNKNIDNENNNHVINTRHLPQGHNGDFTQLGPFNPYPPPPPGNHPPHHPPPGYYPPPPHGNLPNFHDFHHGHPYPHEEHTHHHHHQHPPPFLEPHHIHNPTCGHEFGKPENYDRAEHPIHKNGHNHNNIGKNFGDARQMEFPTITTTTSAPIITTTTTTLKPETTNAEENIFGVDLRASFDTIDKNKTIST